MPICRLSNEQLEEIARSNQSWVIAHLKEETIFDVAKLNQMLELAKEFAAAELLRRKKQAEETIDCRDYPV
jgi:hypothetical protein